MDQNTPPIDRFFTSVEGLHLAYPDHFESFKWAAIRTLILMGTTFMIPFAGPLTVFLTIVVSVALAIHVYLLITFLRLGQEAYLDYLHETMSHPLDDVI